MKTIFENNDGTYTQIGNYLLPNLSLSAEEKTNIGVWAMKHKRYLKQNHKVISPESFDIRQVKFISCRYRRRGSKSFILVGKRP